ncbi:sugar kinase [Streptomyces sp. NPDC059477]|uniref:sugar kinase n=1 Tax=Streptomyces sp. NPDC059477 TaxID=3346847 RepID=UPI00367A451C
MSPVGPAREAMSPSEPPGPPEGHGHMIRRRAFTLMIIVLLIGIPAGYLVISANQSRDSGKKKEEKYAATGLTFDWPSKVQLRLYEVPIQRPAGKVAYYETNNWRTSRLYVQFQTPNANLDEFLREMGTSRVELERNRITISERDQEVAGWNFDTAGPWYGLVHDQKDPHPTQDVMVSLAEPNNPFVYLVSRTTP